MLLGLGACGSPGADSSAFTTMGAMPVSDGPSSSASSSTSGPDPSTTTSTSTSSTDTSGSDTSGEPPLDLGTLPDFGGAAPLGCQGKIDFLFVISRHLNMSYRQKQLVAAFPEFIATIETKFADFDYHIMVVDGDGPPPGAWWGDPTCTAVCPNLACKIGEPCCPFNLTNFQGQPCCDDPSYPCDDLDLVTACDQAWGAGTVFPAGKYTADKPCPIDGDLRYLVKGQSNLVETFACIAGIGNSGYHLIGQALTAAVQKPINDPGGCNRGFLRDDALLLVTLIATGADETELGSKGTPTEWAQAVVDAKHGDEKAVVMFNIGDTACHPYDRVCEMVKMFSFHHVENAKNTDYGPAFLKAASLVEAACAGYVVPG